MTIRQVIKPLFLLAAVIVTGCGIRDASNSRKSPPAGLIATPANYYSTAKARSLGSKYTENLERLAERITRNSTTSQLQFANNISSVGGIGFFTHSATKTPDERYLEVVLSTPETFENKTEYSEKVHLLFSRFGHDLLAILAGDTQIYNDKELNGYGLNLTWRNATPESPASRATMARAIIYFDKERVSGFLRKELGQSELLSDAVIFAVEEDGPLTLVSYTPRESKPDFRPAIREDDLIAGTPKPSPTPGASQPSKDNKQAVEPKIETAKKESPTAAEVKARTPAAKPIVVAETEKAKAAPSAAKAEPPLAPLPGNMKVAAEEAQSANLGSMLEPMALAKPSPEAPGIGNVPDGQQSPSIKQVETTPTKPIEPQKNELELAKQTVRPTPSVVLSRGDGTKPKLAAEIKKQEIVAVPAAKLPAPLPPVETKNTTPTPSGESLEGGIQPYRAPLTTAPKEIEKPATVTSLPIAEVPPAPEAKLIESSAKEAPTSKPAEEDRVIARPVTMATVSTTPDPPAKTLSPAPPVHPALDKSPGAPVARKFDTPGVIAVEPVRPIRPEAKVPVAAPIEENRSEKAEQLALLRKPPEAIVEPPRPPLARPAQKPLEGFIIQLAFSDKDKAQSWAERMQQRGYAVSVTQAGTDGPLRVRLGNFAVREDAERQLRNFKQEGMAGIIINLPQAFRPEARSSVP